MIKKIEWNRVTWYSKLLAIIVFLVVLALGFYLGNTSQNLLQLSNEIIQVLDVYFKLILVSWPAVILILGFLLLFRHRKAINGLIPRIVKFGPTGVEVTPSEQKVSIPAIELETKESERIVENAKDVLNKKDGSTEVQREAELQAQIRALLEQVTILQVHLSQEAKYRLFEKVYRVIFGSQIDLLSSLNGLNKLSYPEAMEFYFAALGRYPLLKAYKVFDYINFLQIVGLVSIEQEESISFLRITAQGKEFLNYLLAENLSFSKDL